MYFIYYTEKGKSKCEACHGGEKQTLWRALQIEAEGNKLRHIFSVLGQRVR
jgi:hypothetical protein